MMRRPKKNKTASVKSRRFCIGLDLDDTIADHSKNLIALAREYGFKASSNYALRALIKEELSSKERDDFQNTLYGPLSLTAPPIKDSLAIIKKIHAEGHALHIISRREGDRKKYAVQWIQKYIPEIARKNIRFVKKNSDKGVLCTKLSVDVFMDDRPEVIENIKNPTTPILFDRFNIYKKTPFERVLTWRDFLMLLKKMSGKKR